MRIEEASKEKYDVIIIGGGATGAGIALDATLRGLKVILFEKKDFASGTSSKSSKLVHGGLRYLEHYKFGLVKESLRERAVLRDNAPHIIQVLPFLIPIYKNQKPRAFLMKMGLWAYDLLSIGKNLGWHKWKNSRKALEIIPNITGENLQGAGYYYDAQMNDARLNLEVILTAKKNGAKIYNYSQVVDFIHKETENANRIAGVVVQDEYNKKHEIYGNIVVNASGAWGDNIAKIEDPNSPRMLGVSKGIHIIVKRFIKEEIAVVVTMKDGRITFIIPFNKNYSIIGTTDTFYDESIEEVIANKEDIDYLLQGVNQLFPEIKIGYKDIISSYAGLRPLVYTPKNGIASASDVSREDKIIISSSGLISIVGGKWTTYRKMGKRVTDKIEKELTKYGNIPKNLKKAKTEKTPLFNGEIKDWDEFYKSETKKVIKILNCTMDTADILVRMYGSNTDQFLEFCKKNPDKNDLLSPKLSYIRNQVVYTIRNEMALHIDDFLMRRTFIVLKPNQGLDCVNEIAEIFAEELNWDDKQKIHEISSYKNYIEKLNAFKN